jgi:hypothetical protein
VLSESEIQDIADTALRETVGTAGYVKAEVRSGVDHDGEKAVFIRAIFRPGAGPIGGEAAVKSLSAVSDALLARGEERFPYLTNFYPDDFPEDDADTHRPAA